MIYILTCLFYLPNGVGKVEYVNYKENLMIVRVYSDAKGRVIPKQFIYLEVSDYYLALYDILKHSAISCDIKSPKKKIYFAIYDLNRHYLLYRDATYKYHWRFRIRFWLYRYFREKLEYTSRYDWTKLTIKIIYGGTKLSKKTYKGHPIWLVQNASLWINDKESEYIKSEQSSNLRRSKYDRKRQRLFQY